MFISDNHEDISMKAAAATERLAKAIKEPGHGYEPHVHMAADNLKGSALLMRQQAHRLCSLADEFDVIAGTYQ